jgi:hypothetical protein
VAVTPGVEDAPAIDVKNPSFGPGLKERARRRTKNRLAKASRKRNRR